MVHTHKNLNLYPQYPSRSWAWQNTSVFSAKLRSGGDDRQSDFQSSLAYQLNQATEFQIVVKNSASKSKVGSDRGKNPILTLSLHAHTHTCSNSHLCTHMHTHTYKNEKNYSVYETMYNKLCTFIVTNLCRFKVLKGWLHSTNFFMRCWFLDYHHFHCQASSFGLSSVILKISKFDLPNSANAEMNLADN